MTERELSFEERATWGRCPVCSAPHGEPCDAKVGRMATNVEHNKLLVTGAHYGRLANAPYVVIENDS